MTNIGWNSLHQFVRYGVHKVFWSLPAITMTIDLLTPKSNQHIYESSVTKIGWNFLHWFVKYCTHSVFRVIDCCDLDLLTQKSNQHIYEPKYFCDQNWVKYPSLVFEIWCSWDAQTHSQTQLQNASGTVFQRCRKYKMYDSTDAENEIQVTSHWPSLLLKRLLWKSKQNDSGEHAVWITKPHVIC